MTSPFLTPRNLADRWSFRLSTLKHWRWSGKGPHYHKIGGKILYHLEDIEKFEREKIRHHTSMKEAPSHERLG